MSRRRINLSVSEETYSELLKADVIVYLQSSREDLYRRFREALIETDPRIGEYVLGCILHPEAHNVYELLGVKRFFYLLTKYEWRPKPGARERIAEQISDICLSMKAEDYLEMPDIITAGMDIALTDAEMKAYREFEREQLMEVDDTEIEAVTAAALANKLLQFSGGAIYDGEHNWHEVGTSKVEALTELVEAAGEPVLVFYAYQHELARLTDALVEYEPVLFRGEPDILERWNRGEIRVLLCHPASVSFGLNMQQGGHIIVWYTPTWNLEQYLQANARLHRQGQQRPVILYHLVATGTLDERVMSALAGKSTCQEFIMQRIKELKQQKP